MLLKVNQIIGILLFVKLGIYAGLVRPRSVKGLAGVWHKENVLFCKGGGSCFKFFLLHVSNIYALILLKLNKSIFGIWCTLW